MEFWFSELHTPNVKFSVKVDRQLYSEENEYVRLDILIRRSWADFLPLTGTSF